MEMRRSKGSLSASAQASAAKEHADPGHSAAVAPGYDARKHAVFSHGHGQAGVAHHERVEHADAGDGAAGNDGDTEQRTANGCGGGHPVTGGEAGRLRDRRAPWPRAAKCK